MALSMLICVGVAAYCFINGMVLTGVLTLVGLIPGPGALPLLISAVMLAVNDHYVTALFPVFAVLNNYFWAVYSLTR